MLRQPYLKKLLQYNNRLRYNTVETLQSYHRRTVPTLRTCRYFLVAQQTQLLTARKKVSLSRRIQTFPVRRVGTTSTKAKPNAGRGKWWYISNGIKIVRIPFIVLSVYHMGYHQGLMDYSREPAKKKAQLLSSIVQGVNVRDHPSELSYVIEGSSKVTHYEPSDEKDDTMARRSNARLLKRVAAVAQKIVRSGRKFVHHEIAKFEARTVGPDSDDDDGLEEGRENLDKAMDSIGICRETKDEIKWTFYLIDTPIPNAFVTELMPHSIFVTTAMMNLFIENDDELALVLGHEISHLMLGHSSDLNKFQSSLSVLEVLLLSIDPTEGLLSILFVACMAYLKKAIAASHSRDNEREADELGIKIAAMSCFDTKSAANVFRKMALNQSQREPELKPIVDHEQANEITHFTDTHPPSMERYASLKAMSEDENADKYRDTYCTVARLSFIDAMRLYQQHRLSS